MYCDTAETILSGVQMTFDFTTQGASFTGATKCTYMITTSLAETEGVDTLAPAFTLTSSFSGAANFDAYTLSYYEYVSISAETA